MNGLELSRIYEEFLEQIGPIALFGGSLILIGREEIGKVWAFMKSLEQKEESIYFDHLVPFCDRATNQWYFYFDGEKIVDLTLSIRSLSKTVWPLHSKIS